MFPDISDRIVDVDDEEYFDEYTIEHHRVNSEEFVNSLGKTRGRQPIQRFGVFFTTEKYVLSRTLAPVQGPSDDSFGCLF